jgi:hypothetical protein
MNTHYAILDTRNKHIVIIVGINLRGYAIQSARSVSAFALSPKIKMTHHLK